MTAKVRCQKLTNTKPLNGIRRTGRGCKEREGKVVQAMGQKCAKEWAVHKYMLMETKMRPNIANGKHVEQTQVS